jgi:glycosyltransferase involved in cell wall biosynthesis
MQNTDYLFFGLFLIAFLIQCYYYFFVFARVAFYKKKSLEAKAKMPVSVVICARNEADNLKLNLPCLLNQNYPHYEIIVVNDASQDDTADILMEFVQQYPHFRYTTIEKDEKFTHGKKLALTIGLKAARHEWVLLTDADCTVMSDKWLMNMQHHFTENKSVVLGYGGFFKEKSFLNKLIRFDCFMIALQYLGATLNGHPYMGVGRNLAYRKSLFFANKGFASHAHLLSGDDDLFVNEVATKKNIAVELSTESFTRSRSKPSFSLWFRQKRRHLTTSKLYRTGSKLFVGLESTSRFLFYSLLLTLILTNNLFLDAALFLAGFRLIYQWVILKFATVKLKEKGFWFIAPFFDILFLFIYFILFLYNFISPNKKR